MSEQDAARLMYDELVSFIRVLGEETAAAGLPAGDRTVVLANVRALIAARARLAAALAASEAKLCEARMGQHLWGRNPETGQLEQLSDEYHNVAQREEFEATYREIGWTEFRLEPPVRAALRPAPDRGRGRLCARRGRGVMQLKHACQILLEAAERDYRGVGTGIRETANGEQRELLKEAHARVWRYVYGPDNPPRDLW